MALAMESSLTNVNLRNGSPDTASRIESRKFLTFHNSDAFRFIGSKLALLPVLDKLVKYHCGSSKDLVFADIFTGTAAVSNHFKRAGYSIIANDNLTFSSTLAKASLLNNSQPEFGKLIESGELKDGKAHLWKNLDSNQYDNVLDYLNSLNGVKGFFYNEYAPNGLDGKFQRKYFTNSNAQRIDAIRTKISSWENDGLLSEEESSLLISDLLKAANKVANIAGTYGYFLKEWDDRAKKPLTLLKSRIIPSSKTHYVFNEDANILVKRIIPDILYLDPPYTWRHYGAYYHILETIAKWDSPKVNGSSGLRAWEGSKSRYCYRNEALDALSELIQNANFNHLFLSYNSEGLITHEQILKIISKVGVPVIYEINYRRYKSHPNEIENTVKERVYYVNRR